MPVKCMWRKYRADIVDGSCPARPPGAALVALVLPPLLFYLGRARTWRAAWAKFSGVSADGKSKKDMDSERMAATEARVVKTKDFSYLIDFSIYF